MIIKKCRPPIRKAPYSLTRCLIGFVWFSRYIGGSAEEKDYLENNIFYDGQFVWTTLTVPRGDCLEKKS